MGKEIELFTGDDWEAGITIGNEGSGPFDASGGTAQASVVRLDKSAPIPLIDAITQNEGATGADWANGLIVAEFPRASTELVNFTGQAFIFIKTTKDGKEKTWPAVPVTVKKGPIG